MAQVKNESEYKVILARVDELFFSTDENTPKDDPRLVELDILTKLVEEYEAEICPIELPSLAETIEYKMRELCCSQKDLSVILGISTSRLSDIINGKKKPTYTQARNLCIKLAIDPAIVLSL